MPKTGQILKKPLTECTIPMFLPSSGTIGANGALTLTTTLPLTLSGGCYFYFPAGAVYSGSDAGLYYVVMSSTTQGTIYNNKYSSGKPVHPTVLVPVSDAGPGAYTQVVHPNVITVFSDTLAANSINNNAPLLATTAVMMRVNNGNIKNVYVYLGSSAIYTFNLQTSQTTYSKMHAIRLNDTSLAAAPAAIRSYEEGNIQLITSGFNLTQDNSLSIALKLNVDTDFAGILYFSAQTGDN